MRYETFYRHQMSLLINHRDEMNICFAPFFLFHIHFFSLFSRVPFDIRNKKLKNRLELKFHQLGKVMFLTNAAGIRGKWCILWITPHLKKYGYFVCENDCWHEKALTIWRELMIPDSISNISLIDLSLYTHT